MKTKIEIKAIYGSILFSFEKEENTVKETIKEAAKIGANLGGAYLSGADLSGADLRSANLRSADLRSANLRSADLSGADLSGADLRSADLSGADLSGADLGGANLGGANLGGADLNENTGFLLSQCPSEGSFIAWKKAHGKIIKLLVCEDAKRSSATSLKCRCSAAIVLEIQDIEGNRLDQKTITSDRTEGFVYTVGEIASVDNFDENRFEECSAGIHFFIAREMAIKY